MISWVGNFFPSIFSNVCIRQFFIFIFCVFFIDFVIHFFGAFLYKKR